MMTISNPTAEAHLLNLPHFPERRAQSDPFADLIDAQRKDGVNHAPMVKLGFDVTIRGGLALVKTTRTYVNQFDGPIEAIMSIPVPVQAAFFRLIASIDGKNYEAQAKEKTHAREIYEKSMDQGIAAVLHEELLRGIHSISVGNLGAGKTAVVTTYWAELLRVHEGTGSIRIPLTVGDVYGISPLEDVDALSTGGPMPQASLRVQHDGDRLELAEGEFKEEEVGIYSCSVPANAPIELKIVGIQPAKLKGGTLDGRQVTMKITPQDNIQDALNVAILVDRSGSMGSFVTYSSEETQHEAVVRGLRQLQPWFIDTDRLALWEFDSECNRVGRSRSNRPETFEKRVSQLGTPRGGTRIGSALEQVGAKEEGKDILLITDGQSYDLDVHRLAKAGHRIFVVLVGEGSLEANVGHLAVLSGGGVRFSYGADVGEAIQSCIQDMRQSKLENASCEIDDHGNPQQVVTAANSSLIEATWSSTSTDPSSLDEFSSAVAAVAASLAFAGAEKRWAAKIAERAGLVTHLTSLILVAEGAEIQEELPTTIKQDLPDARIYSPGEMVLQDPSPRPRSPRSPGRRYSAPEFRLNLHAHRDNRAYLSSPPSMVQRFSNDPPAHYKSGWELIKWVGEQIDWNTAGPKLVKGDFEGVTVEVEDAMMDLQYETTPAAERFAIDADLFVIALAAFAVRRSSKSAARVYRRILPKEDLKRFEEYALELSQA